MEYVQRNMMLVLLNDRKLWNQFLVTDKAVIILERKKYDPDVLEWAVKNTRSQVF